MIVEKTHFMESIQKINLSKLVVIGALSFSLFGCIMYSEPRDSVLNKLVDRGPILIAPSNPYLAANQFLTKQMAESVELTGFFKLKGYPEAFELKDTIMGPLIMTLYYALNQERYALEKNGRTWIISGPFAMDNSEIAKLNIPGLSPRQLSVQPPIGVHQSSTPLPAIKKNAPEKEKNSVPEKNPKLKVPSTPTSIVEPSETPTAVEGFTSPETDTAPVEVTSALSKDSASSSPAELSPRGDLVHYVTMPGETLSAIARWYTQDRENAAKIGRLNRLKNTDVLQIGDTIVIPSYMVVNKSRLTEEDLKALLSAVPKEKVLGSTKR